MMYYIASPQSAGNLFWLAFEVVPLVTLIQNYQSLYFLASWLGYCRHRVLVYMLNFESTLTPGLDSGQYAN